MSDNPNIIEEFSKEKEIARGGDFFQIYETLKTEGLLEKCVTFTRTNYQKFFTEKEFALNEKIWEILSILNLYDKGTLEHSIRTFSITKDLTTKTLAGPHGETVILKDYVETSGVTVRQLLLASLCHDIGKIKLPLEILHNSLTDAEMDKILFAMIKRGKNLEVIEKRLEFSSEELSQKNSEEIIARMYKKGIRPVTIVPLSEAFRESKDMGIFSILKERGFNEDDTILSATKIHEAEGQRIFDKLGDPIIADLVGHHHNYNHESEAEMKYIMKIPILKSRGYDAIFGIYNIIKIADSMDSLQSARSYKTGMSKISALAELSHQVLTGRIEKSICYLWVNTEYQEIKKIMAESGVHDRNLQDTSSVETIEKFLTEAEQEFDRRLTER